MALLWYSPHSFLSVHGRMLHSFLFIHFFGQCLKRHLISRHGVLDTVSFCLPRIELENDINFLGRGVGGDKGGPQTEDSWQHSKSENSRRLWLSDIPCWKGFPAIFDASGKFFADFPASTTCYPCQGLGTFRQGSWLLENRPLPRSPQPSSIFLSF